MAVADVFYEDDGEVGIGAGGGEGAEGLAETLILHWTEGWPTITLPKLRTPLLEGRRGVPVPLRVT